MHNVEKLLEKEALRLYDNLQSMDVTEPNYPIVMDELKVIMELWAKHDKKSFWQKIYENPALISAIAGISGTILVLYFEKADAVISRTFSWIRFK